MRATSLARVTSLLGAFLAISVLMGLIGAGLLLPVVGASGTAAREGVGLFEELPGDLESNPLAQQSRIVAANGSLIATPAQENRIIVGLDEISPFMKQAQVAIEDERFYDHGGLDLRALSRALVSNATSESTQGGSTLTQQYVKLMLQEEARRKGDSEALKALAARSGTEGYVRKLRELKYAVTLEQRLTKDQILEGYLNLAYYGDRVYGVEAAARHYFGVKSKDLNLAEAATLAGVVRAPGRTDPVNYYDASLARRNVVLDKMYEQGMITEAEWQKARDSEINLEVTDSQRSCMNSAHPYFCDYVTEWLLQNPALGATRQERDTLLTTGGLTITTTLDTDLSKLIAEKTREFAPRENEYKLASAAAMVEPGTGHVLAFNQSSKYNIQESRDRFSQTSVNWSVDNRFGGSNGFQIGSVAKAFTIVTALDTGVPIEASLSIRDAVQVDENNNWANPEVPGSRPEGDTQPAVIFEPEDFQEGCSIGEAEWAVRNAEGANHESVITLRKATMSSVNTAFATLASQVGTCNIRDTMTAMGLHAASGEPYGSGPYSVAPTFVLGADNASPLTVATSFATIAAGGLYCPPVPVTKIVDSAGKEIKLDLPGCEQVIDPDVAAGTAELMQEVVSLPGSGFRAVPAGDRPAAGKTGTADESKHTWFAGFTPKLSTAVWIGSPGAKYEGDLKDFTIGDNRVDGWFYGSKLAAVLWKELMDTALEDEPIEQFDEPSNAVLYGEDRPVPDVKGITLEEAIRTLGESGFIGEEVRTSSSLPEGTVLYTSPGAGTMMKAGKTVYVYTSTAYVAPPPPVAPPPVNTPAPPPPAPPPPANDPPADDPPETDPPDEGDQPPADPGPTDPPEEGGPGRGNPGIPGPPGDED
ncbi:transglycosylase domain-containing protein [Ornithinimicrobium cryptoxanthini]|uniref:Transglycosylase domain-containing protein n=1 Tax=Ornithinimicrobium cryptoxanthini TaxID=2934161 RepID=A0ABY4YIS8_9MICO|nr:transglycosylase domain-containing protein [Ornithinimicrobium cryptoxanthini]USQ76666.1 transglycosylase domain-containing protein [Ornithinimicrobium cryptoxanthini]